MPDSDTRNRFRRLIEAELDCAERLLDTLALEHRALRERDTDLLLESAATKEPLLQELQRRAAAHERFLAASGLPVGKEGSRAFLAALPAAAEEHELWHRLQTAASDCRERNTVNGSMLAASRSSVQRALEILRGGPDTGKTYGRGGQTHQGACTTTLGKV